MHPSEPAGYLRNGGGRIRHALVAGRHGAGHRGLGSRVVCEDESGNVGRLLFWAELSLKKGGLFGTAKSEFQTDDAATEEAEIGRRDFVSVQPNPHLREICAEQDFSRLIRLSLD